MKKLLTLILFLFASIISQAQNYNCFTPGANQYFVNDQGYVRGVRIDSIIGSGADLIYYPFKTARGNYFTGSLDSTGGSWLGGKVVRKPSGTHLFDNNWGDTIVVRAQAAIGDNWVFYHDSSAYYYQATVTAVDTLSFMGTIDSVKTITISAYDGLNINPADSLHGFEIMLSKHNGFVQVFDLYTFPYHPHDTTYAEGWDYFLDESTNSALPSKGNSIYRVCDYDFVSVDHQYDKHVGDVYEYSQCSWSGGGCFDPSYYFLDTIKHIYTSGNTTHYIQAGWTATHVSQNYYSISYHDSVPAPCYYCPEYDDSPLMPEEHKQRYSWYYYPNDTSFCLNQPMYYFGTFFLYYETMDVQMFESSFSYLEYKPGIGLVHAYTFQGGGSLIVDERKLVYYDKGGIPCGNYTFPDTTLSVNEFSGNRQRFSIFPNPATDECTISCDGAFDKAFLTIFDVSGRTMQSLTLNNEKTTISLSSFPAGLYYFKIDLGDRAIVNKKVVVVR